jgi:hypothetical protein
MSETDSTDETYRIDQRYVCRECGSPSTVPVHPSDKHDAIGYPCSGDCPGVEQHDPAGNTDWFPSHDK